MNTNYNKLNYCRTTRLRVDVIPGFEHATLQRNRVVS